MWNSIVFQIFGYYSTPLYIDSHFSLRMVCSQIAFNLFIECGENTGTPWATQLANELCIIFERISVHLLSKGQGNSIGGAIVIVIMVWIIVEAPSAWFSKPSSNQSLFTELDSALEPYSSTIIYFLFLLSTLVSLTHFG